MARLARAYAEGVRRISLFVERLVRGREAD
jgi:hypothetical protein